MKKLLIASLILATSHSIFAADNKTTAKPEIWKEQAKFKDLSDKMQAELVKVQAAAKTNNLDNIKAAFGPLGASCKACHDAYRAQ